MFYYVYAIESDKQIYIGFTNDLKNRLTEHNRGESYYTKRRKNWVLIFFEGYINIDDAKRRERYLKTSQGSRLLKRMLKEYFYQKTINQISTTR